MRILNESNEELTDFDESAGYLMNDRLFVQHHDAVEEQANYVTVAEYENGGKDVERIVTVQGVPAWDEYEDIKRYIAYTPEELAERADQERGERIRQLKQMLAETDYCVIKIAEGSAVFDDYRDVISDRQSWRDEINRLETEIEIEDMTRGDE